MAMDPTGGELGPQIQSAISTAVAAVPAGSPVATYQAAVWKAVASAIVTYIQQKAIVNVASVTGVTTGSGVSGPGGGTVS